MYYVVALEKFDMSIKQ